MGNSNSSISEKKDSKDESLGSKSKNDLPVCKESEEYYDYNCDPCSSAGEHAEANGFCLNCLEYLCAHCYKAHKRSKTSSDHRLLDKDNMPKHSDKTYDSCKSIRENAETEGHKCSRQHALLNNELMPEFSDSESVSSVASTGIENESTSYELYNEKYIYTEDVDAKALEDRRNCYITSMAMVSDKELVIGDFFNQSLKRINTECDVVTGYLQLQSAPGGITAISKELVAAVLGFESRILFITTSGELKVLRTLETNANCLDIVCINRKLYVSFKKPVMFQIIQLTGEVQRTIHPSHAVQRLCAFPRYFAVSPDEKMIYVSDELTKKVICIDMAEDRTSIHDFKSDTPTGIVTDQNGYVYVVTVTDTSYTR